MKLVASLSFVIWLVALVGCRDVVPSPGQPIDLSHPVDLGGSTDDLATAGGDLPPSYARSTIAAMRQGKSGTYELDSVVVLAVTPSAKNPVVFVQDAAGGDFSAIIVRCESGSAKHPCSVATELHGVSPGQTITLQGVYEKSSSMKGGFESFYPSSFTAVGTGTLPTATALTTADIQRGAARTAHWFQRVTATLSVPLVIHDFSPPELAFSGAMKCPYQNGFTLVASGSSSAGSPSQACAGTSAQPAAVAASADEVLIGTDFYSGFKVTSDCRCASQFGDKLVTATTSISGTLSGILVYDVPFMMTTGYQYIAPVSAADAPLTGLQ